MNAPSNAFGGAGSEKAGGSSLIKAQQPAPNFDLKKLWADVLAILHEQIDAASFQAWIAPLTLAGVARSKSCVGATETTQEYIVTLSAPSSFAQTWVNARWAEQLIPALQSSITQITNAPTFVTLNFALATGSTSSKAEASAPATATEAPLHALRGIGTALKQVASSKTAQEQRPPKSANTPSRTTPSSRPANYLTPPPSMGISANAGRGPRFPQPSLAPTMLQRPSEISGKSGNAGRKAGHSNFKFTEDAPPADQTFDTFQVAQTNQFALHYVRRVVEQQGERGQTLIVSAPMGSGKTHLLHAAWHEARQTGRRTLFVALRHGTLELTGEPEYWDLLFVENLHILGRAEYAPEAEIVGRLLATAQKNGVSTIITSRYTPERCLPMDHPLTKTLYSAGNWRGTIVPMSEPGIYLRAMILRDWAAARGVTLSKDAAHLLSHSKMHLGEIYKQWGDVVKAASQQDGTLSLESAEAFLEMLEARDPASTTRITPSQVIDTVLHYYGATIQDMRSESRSQDVLLPRQVAMYLLREVLALPYSRIAEMFGKRDHTTAMHSCIKIEGLRDTDLVMRTTLETLTQRLHDQLATN